MKNMREQVLNEIVTVAEADSTRVDVKQMWGFDLFLVPVVSRDGSGELRYHYGHSYEVMRRVNLN